MNRYFALAVMGALLVGCAADADDDATTAPTQNPEQTEQEGQIVTFQGQLARPGQAAVTYDDAQLKLLSPNIRNYKQVVADRELDLPRYNQSNTAGQ